MKKFITENEEQSLYDENGIKRSYTTRKKIIAKMTKNHIICLF